MAITLADAKNSGGNKSNDPMPKGAWPDLFSSKKYQNTGAGKNGQGPGSKGDDGNAEGKTIKANKRGSGDKVVGKPKKANSMSMKQPMKAGKMPMKKK